MLRGSPPARRLPISRKTQKPFCRGEDFISKRCSKFFLQQPTATITPHQAGEAVISASYFPCLAAVSRARLRDDPKAKWMVQFHPLVTASIERLAYRQFNYGLMMHLSTQLARWLHNLLALK